jgi:anti-anti-sigma factor
VETLSIQRGSGISLAGELDLSTAPELDEVLQEAVEHGGAVLIDLTELSFMDSTGIHSFLKAADSLRGRGCLILHGEQDRVRRVLDLVGLNGNIRNLHRLAHEAGKTADGAETGSLPSPERRTG